MSNFVIETFTTKTNKVDLVDAAHINAVQSSIVAIETALNIVCDQNGSLNKGTSYPGSPIQGQTFYRTDLQKFAVYDGGWVTINLSGAIPTNIQTFTSSGTWTRPAGVNSVWVKVIGGGGNGSNGSSSVGGAGGGGGGYAEGIITVTGNVTVTIGATNSFAGSTTIQATAGSNASVKTPGTGGSGSNGTINLTGSTGQGGGGDGGSGGGSPLGCGGGAGISGSGNTAGAAGGSYGGGGGGAGSTLGGGGGGGGTGDPGAVIVYWAQ